LAESSFTLELSGSLEERNIEPGKAYPVGYRVHAPVILGEVASGPVTLLDAAAFVMAPFVEEETWYVGLALLGDHVEQDTTYDQIRVATEHLDDFALTPFVKPEFERDDTGDWRRIRLEVERIVRASGHVPEVGLVEVGADPDYEHGGRHGDVGLRGELRLTTLTPVDQEQAIEQAGKLRALVRLATACPCAITALTLRRSHTGSLVKVLRLTAAVGRKPCERGTGIGRQLFTVAQLPAGPETFALWWEMVERYQRGWTLLTVHDDGRYPNVGERLAGYARAIEAMHHADFGPPQLADEEQDERTKRVLAVVPDDLRDWVQGLLQNSTPPQFRHRILQVLNYLGSPGSELCGGDPDAFAQAVTSTRNYITHPKVKAKGIITDVQGQLWIGSSLYWIGHCYLVKRLGVTDDDLGLLIERIPGTYEVIQQMRVLMASPRTE
jgi:Apea-like HEPN/ApeA N-terminal domain 1